MDVVTTFLRAIRVGTIAVQHGAVLLSHYGRLGATFDACAEVIVKMIKDEGLSKDNGELVVKVVTKSLQEAFNLALEGRVEDESESLALAKLLSQTFVLRGSQLSILKRLDAEFIVQIHMKLVNWVAKRLVAYESNKNKKLKRISILFFRLLVPLVNGVDDEHALRMYVPPFCCGGSNADSSLLLTVKRTWSRSSLTLTSRFRRRPRSGNHRGAMLSVLKMS